MYAHFHVDDFRLLQSTSDPLYRRTSFIMLAASMSPCYDNNPNFRVVLMDSKSQTIEDYHQYYVDLVMATGNFKVKLEIQNIWLYFVYNIPPSYCMKIRPLI